MTAISSTKHASTFTARRVQLLWLNLGRPSIQMIRTATNSPVHARIGLVGIYNALKKNEMLPAVRFLSCFPFSFFHLNSVVARPTLNEKNTNGHLWFANVSFGVSVCMYAQRITNRQNRQKHGDHSRCTFKASIDFETAGHNS